MKQDQPLVPFDRIANQFTCARRAEFIEKIYPHIAATLKPGERVLDRCCGAGSNTVFLAEQGAQIVGIDLAPHLIPLAHEETLRRGANAKFIQASVLSHPLGECMYDLALCFGNAITDFPHRSFPHFRDQVFTALWPGGYFILEYIDGLNRVAWMSEPEEVLEQGVDSQIRCRFIAYDPVDRTN